MFPFSYIFHSPFRCCCLGVALFCFSSLLLSSHPLQLDGLARVCSQSGTVAGKEVPGAGGMSQQAVRLQGLSYMQRRVEELKCSCSCCGVGCPQEAGDCLVQLLLPLVQELAFGFPGVFGALSHSWM